MQNGQPHSRLTRGGTANEHTVHQTTCEEEAELAVDRGRGSAASIDDADSSGQVSQPEPESGNKDRFDIIGVNNGAEATTVVNVGIQSVGGSNGIDVQQERDKGTKITGPDLPARIEEHGASVWVIEADLTRGFTRGTKLIGYMHKYRRYHKYPKSRRSMIRVYETVHHFVKN